MAETMTADTLLAMAIDLEHTGQTFYESLAAGCGNREIAVLCGRLAKAEVGHAELLTAMRRHLPQAGRTMTLTEDIAEHFHLMARDAVIPKPAEVKDVALRGTFKDAVAMAIRMEQAGIAFYEGLLRTMQAENSAVIHRIISEEKGHLYDLRALKA